MPYVYALIFAVLISPVQTWLGTISGAFFGQWERFSAEMATGALFAYAALLAAEAMLRIELIPTVIRQTRPRLVRAMMGFGMTWFFASLVCLCALWWGNQSSAPVPKWIYVFAAILCFFALCLSLGTTWIESRAKAVIEETMGDAPASKKRKPPRAKA